MNIIEPNLCFDKLIFLNTPSIIVLHHSAKSYCTIYDIHSWHKNKNNWCGIGYHFFVAKDGQVFRGRPENAIGAHSINHNVNSIGICAEGNFMNEKMPEVQKNSLISLCDYLAAKYNTHEIVGHKELNSTNCPGKYFPLEEIKQHLNLK